MTKASDAMATNDAKHESVEALAIKIVDGITGNPHQTRAGKIGYVEGVLLGTCWQRGIDPTTMQPMDDGEKGNTMADTEHRDKVEKALLKWGYVQKPIQEKLKK